MGLAALDAVGIVQVMQTAAFLLALTAYYSNQLRPRSSVNGSARPNT